MNTPPPFHRYHSSPNSSFGFHTPRTDSSFDRMSNYNGSDRHSDRPLFGAINSQPLVKTRRPSLTEAELIGTGSSFSRGLSPAPAMMSAMEKDWLYFSYTKSGAKWDEDPIIDELPWSEADIRKKAASKSERGSASFQMKTMGPNRRSQIEKHAMLLGSMEADGSIWEPVWIDNIQWKVINFTSEVMVFEVIFARRQPREYRHSFGLPPTAPMAPEVEFIRAEASAERQRKEKRKSRDKKGNILPGILKDDAFSSTEWFDLHSGAANTGLGVGGLGYRDSPPATPLPKSARPMKPKVVQGVDFDSETFGVYASGALGDSSLPAAFEDPNKEARDILQNLPKLSKNDDGIVIIDDDQGSRRHSRHSSKDATQRRNTNTSTDSRPSFVDLRQRLDSGLRGARPSSHYALKPDMPRSGGSSTSSGDVGVMFDDVEDLTSQTSRGTGSSSSRKIKRTTSSAYRPSQSSGNYELASDSSSKRRSSRAVGKSSTQTPYGLEQSLKRSNTSPRSKPSSHRTSLLGEVPPIVLYPDDFDKDDVQTHVPHEHRHERLAHDYIERTVRDTSSEKRGDEIERDSVRSGIEKLQLNRESGVRSSVYNHEPRDSYNPARRGL